VVIAYAVIQNSLAGAQGAWFPELFNANTRSSGVFWLTVVRLMWASPATGLSS
jgi:hypothetical protein